LARKLRIVGQTGLKIEEKMFTPQSATSA